MAKNYAHYPDVNVLVQQILYDITTNQQQPVWQCLAFSEGQTFA